MQTLAWIGPRVVEKSLTEQKNQTNKKTYSKTNTSPFALTSEWPVKKSWCFITICKAHSKVTHIKQQKYFHHLNGCGYNKDCVLYPRRLRWWKCICCFICVTLLWALYIVIKHQFFTFISDRTESCNILSNYGTAGISVPADLLVPEPYPRIGYGSGKHFTGTGRVG